MLRSLGSFLKRDWGYVVLLIFVIGAYTFASLTKHKEAPSPALEKVQKAEVLIKERLQKGEALNKIVPPSTALTLFALFTLLIILMTGAGLVMDVAYLARPPRDNLSPPEDYPAVNVAWDMSDCVRVIILLLTFAVVLSFYFAFLYRLFFHGSAENAFVLLHTTLTDLAAVFFIIFMVSKRGNDSLNSLGLQFKNFLRNAAAGFLGYLKILPIFVGSLALVLLISQLLKVEPPPHPLVGILVEEEERNPFLIFYSIVLACVIGPVIEEIFFRGFCYPAIKKRWGKALAVFITALVFAAIHGSLFAFLPVFILGVALAFLYEKYGTLVPSIVMHIVHNSLFIGYFFLIKHSVLDKIN
ncbi:MAG: type II CAAX endopeptidase family protein [Candidatus Omnitrophica bacterium]|nr:type II CAAX endopeptidase family protein [Candidatus Omnitrophota bacterium]